MLGRIYRKLRVWRLSRGYEPAADMQREEEQTEFPQGLDQKLDILSGAVKSSGDIIIRRFTFAYKKQTRAAIVFIDGMTDKALLCETVLKPLMHDRFFDQARAASKAGAVSYIREELLYAGDVTETGTVQKAVGGLLSGDTLLLVDGVREVLLIGLRHWEKRGIEESKTESSVRGPREGFTETLQVNTALLRRKIKNADFRLETMQIGARTKTDVCVAYIDGLADPKLIEEIRRRLARINTDAILESGYIEELIEDAPMSIFSTIANSEKPDKVAAKLLEGRAAILVDGTPFVLTVPMLFVESFQAAEDYYSRPLFASVVRATRYLAFFISVFAPALYVALSTFHQELIPTPLLLTMAAAHEGIPFPSVLEAGLMVVAFEILREAGVRLPRPVGQAISIVGALVIGESAVSAGLIGAPMVIVVAVTAVSSFIVTPQIDAGAVMRYFFLILAGVMGGYGIASGALAILVHLASLRSFGTPYLSPLAPFNAGDMKDSFIRAPIWKMSKRPKDIAGQDEVRQGTPSKPAPPREKESHP